MPTVKKLKEADPKMPGGVYIDKASGEMILTRLRYSVETTAHILDICVSTVYEEIKQKGRLIAECPNGIGKKPIYVTRASILDYRKICQVSKEKWSE